MEWSNQNVLDFLDCYEKEPVIWNPCHVHHKNRNAVYDAWKRVEINLGGKYTISDLKKKKDSLMASFRTCCKKVKESMKNRAGTEEIYKPNWFAYEKMFNFLMDKDQPRKAIHSKDIESLEESENDEINEDGDSDSNRENIRKYQENTSDDNLNEEVLPSPSKSSFKPPSQKRMKTEADELKSKMDEAYSLLQRTTQQNTKQKDLFDKYGELVAEKLRELNETSRDIAMNRIDNLLFQIKIIQNIPDDDQSI